MIIVKILRLRAFAALILAAVLSFVVSCSAKGVIHGRIRESGQSVYFSYKGKKVKGFLSKDEFMKGIVILSKNRDKNPAERHLKGKGTFSMIAKKGRRADCFLKSYSAISLGKGGRGYCNISDGQTIDFVIEKAI